jgi:hypothetical protein
MWDAHEEDGSIVTGYNGLRKRKKKKITDGYEYFASWKVVNVLINVKTAPLTGCEGP